MTDTVLLTGATGFLGMEVLVRLLDRTDTEVLALVRANDPGGARARLDDVLDKLYDTPTAAVSSRVHALAGDVTQPHLGLDGDAFELAMSRTTSIIHCAAAVQFDASLAYSLATNTLGTARMLELAERLRATVGLPRVIHVSTAYVAGRRTGTITGRDLDLAVDFRNPYEQTKAYAEHLLRSAPQDLPLTIARPSIIVGDSTSGWTPTFNVIYWPLRAYERGLLKAVPMPTPGILDVVPVDYVADALLALHDAPPVRETVQLVAGANATSTHELAQLATAVIGPAARRHESTAHEASLDDMELFGPYLDVGSSFAAEAHALPGITAPRLAEYFPALVAYARLSRWGKRPLTREAANRHVRAPEPAGVAHAQLPPRPRP